jgi:phosphate transport system protein
MHNSKTVVSGTNLVIALKHFERIADHSTNIAESVFFMINEDYQARKVFNNH